MLTTTLTIARGEPTDEEIIEVVLVLCAVAAQARRPCRVPRRQYAAATAAFANPRSWTNEVNHPRFRGSRAQSVF